MKEKFKYAYKVKTQDLDALGHVNNIVYLKWVQHVAYLHWNELVTNELRTKYVWMVLRHEIDYVGQAFLGNEIDIQTWIGESSGVKSTRIVEMYHKNTLIAKSKSTFCLLNAKTKKPQRIGTDLLNLFKI